MQKALYVTPTVAFRLGNKWALGLTANFVNSTIYLRHHYFVDLVAGWLLAPAALWVAPRVDAWWARQQLALGYEPARGAAPSS